MAEFYEWFDDQGRSFMVDPDWRPSNVGRCRGCSQLILWVTTKAGRKMPVNANGTSHFSNCPKADSFRGPEVPLPEHP